MLQVPIMKKLTILKISITLILFYGALRYEHALTYRATMLTLMFGVYILVNLFRIKIRSEKIKLLTYIMEISIIYIMEQNSRYLVNYIFHLFYFLTLLEVPLNLKRLYSLTLCTIIMFMSSIKFVILLVNKPSLGNLYQSIFFIATGIFLLLLMNFLKYYKDEKESKEKLNKELIKAEQKLKEAAIIQERNRIARDIHDTIGHSITGTIMGLEMVQVLMEDDLPKAKDMIKYLKDSSRENLVKVREVVSTLYSNEGFSKGLESINELIDSFKLKSNTNINLEIKGEIIKLSPSTNIVIYRTLQEGLTNAIRHGRSNNIDIYLEYFNDFINLIIEDNGIGSTNIVKGYGLKGMEDRVLALGGKIEFSSDKGFKIRASIPLEVKYD